MEGHAGSMSPTEVSTILLLCSSLESYSPLPWTLRPRPLDGRDESEGKGKTEGTTGTGGAGNPRARVRDVEGDKEGYQGCETSSTRNEGYVGVLGSWKLAQKETHRPQKPWPRASRTQKQSSKSKAQNLDSNSMTAVGTDPILVTKRARLQAGVSRVSKKPSSWLWLWPESSEPADSQALGDLDVGEVLGSWRTWRSRRL